MTVHNTTGKWILGQFNIARKKKVCFPVLLPSLLQQFVSQHHFPFINTPPPLFSDAAAFCTFWDTAFHYRLIILSLNDCVFPLTAPSAIPSCPFAQHDDVRTVFWSQQTCQKQRVWISPPLSLVHYMWCIYFHSGSTSTLSPPFLFLKYFSKWTVQLYGSFAKVTLPQTCIEEKLQQVTR